MTRAAARCLAGKRRQASLASTTTVADRVPDRFFLQETRTLQKLKGDLEVYVSDIASCLADSPDLSTQDLAGSGRVI